MIYLVAAAERTSKYIYKSRSPVREESYIPVNQLMMKRTRNNAGTFNPIPGKTRQIFLFSLYSQFRGEKLAKNK